MKFNPLARYRVSVLDYTATDLTEDLAGADIPQAVTHQHRPV